MRHTALKKTIKFDEYVIKINQEFHQKAMMVE